MNTGMSSGRISGGLDRRWVSVLRSLSTGAMIVALLTMLISLTVVFYQPNDPGNSTTRTTIYGVDAPAPKSRLGRQPLAWVPIGAFGAALLAYAVRMFAEHKQRQIDASKARLGIFPPPRRSRWDRFAARVGSEPPEDP